MHRTLADHLRSWPADRLGRLLLERPDLATPAPHDSAQLASRAATRASIIRALDQLNRLELSVLDALVIAGQTTPTALADMLRAGPGIDQPLERLQDLALCWDTGAGIRPLSAVAEILPGSDGTSRLRPISGTPRTSEEIAARLAALSARGRALLEHVVESGGEGRTQTAGGAGGPVEELLAAGLLLPRTAGSFIVPGEVGLALRGGRTTTSPIDERPDLATGERDPALVARSAAGAAFEAVRRVALLLEEWGLRPPRTLRTGGLAVRDLKAAAGLLHVAPAEAALLIEVGYAAGLLAVGVVGDDEAWLPTDAFDAWLSRSPAQRWTALVTAWLDTPRTPAAVGARDASGKALNALAPELSNPWQAESRRMALAELAALEPDRVLAAGTGLPSLLARIRWLRPRRPGYRDQQVEAALNEAALLGMAGLGGLPPAARAVLAGDPDAAAATLAPLLPEPVDHLLVQADLTAVAPGPLTEDLNRTLHLLADVESRGGATVWRFTKNSLRRAFDAGWSAAEVHAYLGGISRTPLPQPLTYLVDDVARTFGVLRAGHAEAFLRSDDEAALAELLHHPKAASLRLRQIAPTVLITDVGLDVLLPRLRELGAGPVLEAPDGTVRVARADVHRARLSRGRRPTPGGRGEADGHSPAQRAARAQARATSVAGAIRAGDAARAVGGAGRAEATTPQGALVALREAVESGTSVLIGYVDNHGTTTQRLIDPRRVEGGQVTAYDHRSADLRVFAVHRITGVQPVAD